MKRENITYIDREECRKLLEYIIDRKLKRIETLCRLLDYYRARLPDNDLVRKIYYNQSVEYLNKNIKDLVALISKLSAVMIHENAMCMEHEDGRIEVVYKKLYKKEEFRQA